MSHKHIFIGIGGAGVGTVSLIKQKVYERYQEQGTKTRADQMNEKYRFLFIDTDPRDVLKANENNRDTYESGRIPFINPQTELVSLAQGNAHAIFEEAKHFPNSMINQRILEACSDELAAMIPDQPLALGAGAFRMKSRISFARSMSEFQQKLQAHIEDLNSVKLTGGEETSIMYWLVSSCLGGTGSGIVNDVLYYINMQHQRSIGDGDPHLVYTMYMPKFYIDKNSTEEKYSANAYAMLSEIESVKAWSMDEKRNKLFHRLALVKDYNLINSDSRYDPFYYMIPIDCQTDKGSNIGSAMYSNTAEMLYYIHEGNGGDALHSDVDNYMHDLYFARPKGFLVPMGYIALRKPEAELTQYVEARLKRDILLYGLRNEASSKVDDKDSNGPVAKLYKEAFATSLAKYLKDKKDELLEDKFNSNNIKNDNGDVLLTAKELEEKGVTPDCYVNVVEDFKQIPELSDRIKAAKQEVMSKLWNEADIMLREHGSEYTADFYKKLIDYAKGQYKNLQAAVKPEEVGEELVKAWKDVEDFKLSEKVKTSKQKNDVENFFGKLRDAADRWIDYEIGQKNFHVMGDLCNQDGEGQLKVLYNYLESFNRTVTDMANEAAKSYKKLANKMGEKSQDVTSVYLPDLKTICDSNGWLKNNIFSRLYEYVLKTTNVTHDGDDNSALRLGEDSLMTFFDKAYSSESRLFKEISAKGYANGKTVRVLANESRSLSSGPTTCIEDFLYYVRKEFMDAFMSNDKVQGQWYNKAIAAFFDDLDSKAKDKVRQSLRPSLFFNHKGNRIAVDYREFLIFVAADQELATRMLGFQDGNPNHRFIGDKSGTGAALVIRAKYGLSFSDYRMWDNLKTIYDKAPRREKYHFHHYFAEFGETLSPDDLPYEIATPHRVYAKMLFLRKFCQDFKEFFYECNEYQNKKHDYAKFILVDNGNGNFEVARPKAISLKEGKLCLTIVDKNAKLFAEFEGKNFAEAFAAYQKSFVQYGLQETYTKFLNEVEKFKVYKETPTGTEVISGEDIIKSKFKEYRTALLKELDDLSFSAETEAEKALYRVFFSVIDSEVINARSL